MIKPYEDGKLILKTLVITVFVLIILGYSIYQAQKIIHGPEIVVTSPASGSTVRENSIEIVGTTKNISEISLNGRPIFIDESGKFSEKLMLYLGYNIIKLKAQDKFGAKTEKNHRACLQEIIINIIYGKTKFKERQELKEIKCK
jgi:hypothetical protein